VNKYQLRKFYVELFKQKIKAAEFMINDPYVDKLKDILDSSRGYSLFRPLDPVYNDDNSTINIDDLARLYSWILYSWDDDGSMSLVYADLIHKYPKGVSLGSFHTYDIFVMQGHWSELKYNEIEQLVGSREDIILSQFLGITLNRDTLDFIHSLVPRFYEEGRLCRTEDSWEDKDDYFKFRKETEGMIIDYIYDHLRVTNR